VSVTVGPRVEFDPDHYPRLRVWDPRAGHDRYLYLHRLTAYAHGEIDSLWSDDHVHHRDSDPWHNQPGNLEGLNPTEHGQTTAARDALDDPETVGVEYGICHSCNEGRPHERLTDGAIRCVVCGHPTEGPDSGEQPDATGAEG